MGKPFSFRHRFFSRFHDVIISKIGRGCLVGAALRAVRTTSRPHTTDASERRPYHLAALVARRKEVVFTSCSSCFQNPLHALHVLHG